MSSKACGSGAGNVWALECGLPDANLAVLENRALPQIGQVYVKSWSLANTPPEVPGRSVRLNTRQSNCSSLRFGWSARTFESPPMTVASDEIVARSAQAQVKTVPSSTIATVDLGTSTLIPGSSGRSTASLGNSPRAVRTWRCVCGAACPVLSPGGSLGRGRRLAPWKFGLCRG